MGRTIPVLTLLLIAIPLPATAHPDGLRILVTFSNLLHDLKLLACPSDSVDYLAPPGLDPHEYELRPADIGKIREADLIVSTAHTPFEISIRGMVLRGEIKARLVEIPSIEGIRIYENPMTGQPNYHMPIYDPLNYLTFMRELRDILKELNPSCSKDYDSNYLALEGRVRRIMDEAQRMNMTALASAPTAQYALEWLGIKVRFLLMKEEGLPATLSELSEIYRAARNNEIGIVVTLGDESTPANLKAVEVSEEFGIRKVSIPSPLDQSSIPEKLTEVVRSLKGSGSNRPGTGDLASMQIALVAVLLFILLMVVYFVRRRP